MASIARRRAVVKSQAAGLSGIPERPQLSSAATKEACTTSSASARLWGPKMRVSTEMSRPDSRRKAASISTSIGFRGAGTSEDMTLRPLVLALHPPAARAEAHLVEQRLVLAPALADLHEQAQEHLRPQEVLDLLAGLAADELQHRAAAADQDPLLVVALDEDRALDP